MSTVWNVWHHHRVDLPRHTRGTRIIRRTEARFVTLPLTLVREHNYLLLPPMSKGWGKVIFSVCLSVHRVMGYPSLRSQVHPWGRGAGNPVSGPRFFPGVEGGVEGWEAVGIPQSGARLGYPLPPHSCPLRQNMPWTGYAVGSMLLAVTKENFLVVVDFMITPFTRKTCFPTHALLW